MAAQIDLTVKPGKYVNLFAVQSINVRDHARVEISRLRLIRDGMNRSEPEAAVPRLYVNSCNYSTIDPLCKLSTPLSSLLAVANLPWIVSVSGSCCDTSITNHTTRVCVIQVYRYKHRARTDGMHARS
jgi:hypothetical protein